MSSILPAAITAIGGFFGNMFNKNAADKAWDKQVAFSQQQQFNQQKWIESMWRQNNSYNSPAAQMKRYKEAGLNPDLIYSQGNAGNSAMPSPAAQASMPVAAVPNYINPLEPFAAVAMQKAQIENLNANTQKTNEETKGIIIANDVLPANLYIDLQNKVKSGKLTDKQISQINENISLMQQQRSNLQTIGKQLSTQLSQMNEDYRFSLVQHAFESESMKMAIDRLSVQLNMDKEQLSFFINNSKLQLSKGNFELDMLAADCAERLSVHDWWIANKDKHKFTYDINTNEGYERARAAYNKARTDENDTFRELKQSEYKRSSFNKHNSYFENAMGFNQFFEGLGNALGGFLGPALKSLGK